MAAIESSPLLSQRYVNKQSSPHRTSPSKRYSHAGTPPYKQYSRSSLDYDSPSYYTSSTTHSRKPSSTAYSPLARRDSANGDTLADELAQALNDDSGLGDNSFHSDATSTPCETPNEQLRFRSPSWTASATASPSKAKIKARDSGVELVSSPATTPVKDAHSTSCISQQRCSPDVASRYSWDGGTARRAYKRNSNSSDQESQQSPRKESTQIFVQADLDARAADIAGLAAQAQDEDKIVPDFLKNITSLPNEAGLELLGRNYAKAALSAAYQTNFHLQDLKLLFNSVLLRPQALAPEDLSLLSDELSELQSPGHKRHVAEAARDVVDANGDLNECLWNLPDSLHSAREIAASAARRVQSTRELVAQTRRELAKAEQARVWLEDGEWDRRIGGREAARTCKEILAGFGDVCESMGAQLLRSPESAVGVGLVA